MWKYTIYNIYTVRLLETLEYDTSVQCFAFEGVGGAACYYFPIFPKRNVTKRIKNRHLRIIHGETNSLQSANLLLFFLVTVSK